MGVGSNPTPIECGAHGAHTGATLPFAQWRVVQVLISGLTAAPIKRRLPYRTLC